MMFSIFRIHSYCVPVFFCVHFHCFGRPRIPDFLELWTAGLLDAGLLDAGLLDAGLLECMHTVLERGRDLCASLLHSSTACVHFNYVAVLCSSTCLCAHPYCIPALACAHLYYVQAISGCIPAFPLCASLLYSSIACVHSYYVQALPVDITIMPQHFSLCASLLYSSIVCVHSYYVQAFSCMHFYFHVCAFMPYSGTTSRGKLSKSILYFHYSSITFPL